MTHMVQLLSHGRPWHRDLYTQTVNLNAATQEPLELCPFYYRKPYVVPLCTLDFLESYPFLSTLLNK